MLEKVCDVSLEVSTLLVDYSGVLVKVIDVLDQVLSDLLEHSLNDVEHVIILEEGLQDLDRMRDVEEAHHSLLVLI